MALPNPKRSSDDYIQLKKKITDKELRNTIARCAKQAMCSEVEMCYQWIRERAVEERKKLENKVG